MLGFTVRKLFSVLVARPSARSLRLFSNPPPPSVQSSLSLPAPPPCRQRSRLSVTTPPSTSPEATPKCKYPALSPVEITSSSDYSCRLRLYN